MLTPLRFTFDVPYLMLLAFSKWCPSLYYDCKDQDKSNPQTKMLDTDTINRAALSAKSRVKAYVDLPCIDKPVA